MSADKFPGRLGFGEFMELNRLDSMSLAELCELFDRECDQARSRGLWLFEFNRAFSDYCVVRLPHLARLASGAARPEA